MKFQNESEMKGNLRVIMNTQSEFKTTSITLGYKVTKDGDAWAFCSNVLPERTKSFKETIEKLKKFTVVQIPAIILFQIENGKLKKKNDKFIVSFSG